MKNKTTTQDEFLWKDEKAIKAEQYKMVKASLDLNKFINESRRLLGSLTTDQMEKLRIEKFTFLYAEVKKLFQFPKASDQFNLEALGIDLTKVKELSKSNWNLYDHEIDSGVYMLSDEQPQISKHYKYADTEAKRQALRIANGLVDLVNDLERIGILHGQHLASMTHACYGVVKVVGDPRHPNARIEVDKERIALYIR